MKAIITLAALLFLLCSHDSMANNPPKARKQGNKKKNAIQVSLGSKHLLSNELPSNWEPRNVYAESDMTKYDSVLSEVNNYYDRLAHKKSYPLPKILKLEKIPVFGDEHLITCIDSVLSDSFQIRLPDVGQYSCFYSSRSFNWNQPVNEHCQNGKYTLAGNLILYHPALHIAKLIPVCFENNEEFSVSFRYFYYTGNQILLFEGGCDEETCGIEQKYLLQLASDGSVKVKAAAKK